MSEQSRITVVGDSRRVDVAVPSWTPIGEYAPRLATICGQDPADVLPPAWSLAVAGQAALPPDNSLADAGVVDGQVLYLRDLAVEPVEAPVVFEVDEAVAEEAQRLRRERLRGGPATVGAGLLWLFATAVAAAATKGAGTGAAAALIVTGLLLAAGAWTLAHQRDTVPYAVRLGVALTAVPILAGGGVLAGAVLTGGHPWESGLIGANVGALLALAAMPGPALFAVQLQLVVALLTATLIRGLAAETAGAAAVATVIAVGTAALARRLAALVATWAGRRADIRAAEPGGRTAELVGRSRHVLGVLLTGPAVTLVVALPVLTLSGHVFALFLTAAAALVLLVRLRQAAFTVETVALGAALAVGSFGLVAALARGAGGTTLIVVLAVTGVAVAGAGIALCVLNPPAGGEEPRGPRPVHRRSALDLFGMVAVMALAPLAMGVFGVFGQLLDLGRTMF